MFYENTLTQNNIKIKRLQDYYSERAEEFIRLRNQGLTYKQIADMFEPPYTRQAIHLAIKTYLKRKGETKADSSKSA